MSKKTVILGASENPQRYAYMAFKDLSRAGHEVVPVGYRPGSLDGVEFLLMKDKPEIPEVDTITLYVGIQNLEPWFDYIIGLKPKRVIFNPGTENRELIKQVKAHNIEAEIGCTLIMLRTRTF